MKNLNNRVFWTALGTQLLREGETSAAYDLPEEMRAALGSGVILPPTGTMLRGEGLPGKRGRHVYDYTWKILRGMGFSRPFRCEVFDGVVLFAPFAKNRLIVIPQGFQKRIPLDLRARALIGKNAALRARGFFLVVSAAVWEEKTWNLLVRGGCTVCTPDKLGELVPALDLQAGIKQI